MAVGSVERGLLVAAVVLNFVVLTLLAGQQGAAMAVVLAGTVAMQARCWVGSCVRP